MGGTWLITFAAVFSEMGVVLHTAYVASLAPPVAALSGAGIVMFGRWYRAGDRRGLLLPLAVAVEVAWAVRLWSYFPGFLPWARWAVTVAGGITTVALALAWRSRRAPSISCRLLAAVLAAGVAVLLAAPMTWALSVLDPVYAGGSFNAVAGPGGVGANPFTLTTTLGGTARRVYAYVSAHRHGASYLLAVQTWFQASPYIVATGQEVLPMGGFSGQAPEPTPAHIRQLVHSGQLRFFQIVGGPVSAALGGPEVYKITGWVRQACRMIPARDYGPRAAAGPWPYARGREPVALYECGRGN